MVSGCPQCGREDMQEFTGEVEADMHDNSRRIYLSATHKDYRVLRASWCRSGCRGIHVTYEEVR